MDQTISRLSYLFKRYTEQNCTPEERNEFFEMVMCDENILELNHLISNAVSLNKTNREMNSERADKLFRNILNAASGKTLPMFSPKKSNRIWWAAAAIIILILGSVAYFILNTHTIRQIAKKEDINKRFKNDMAPGHEGAILTLSNGQQITLDSAHSGKLAMQGSTNIVKQNGKIVYNEQEISGSEVLYNTMTTPKGRQYSLVLADGTKVWLNAASSITYPTAFTGKERIVQLIGEAYFEVAPLTFRLSETGSKGGNGKMPLKVQVKKMEVNVLGTHFNIMAYDDESLIKTTLLEGSVRVIKVNANALLKPGQQAILNQAEENFKVAEADVEEAVAWKNGLFEFNSTGIESIMRQLRRWYDIEVIYQGDVAGKNFSGLISRNTNLSQVLKMLQLTKEVHFKVEGNRITVLP